MTSAEFECYVREMNRIKAIRALQLAEVLMLPHISTFARKEWFRSISKVLKPKFTGNEMLTFNGRAVNFKQFKRAFGKVADKFKYGKVS